jgi:hypothetical protein
MPDEQLQDRESREQNIQTMRSRRNALVARLDRGTDTDRRRLQEEIDSIDANLRLIGAESDGQDNPPADQ